MEKIVLYLKDLLKAEKFILTGSYALQKIGLFPWAVNDLDVLLYKPIGETTAFLKAVKEVTQEAEEYPDEDSFYQIKLPQVDGTIVKVDVWIIAEKEVTRAGECFDLADGTSISTIPGIIKAKKSYTRGKNHFKHLVQRKAMAGLIYKEGEFEAYVSDQVKGVTTTTVSGYISKLIGTKNNPFQYRKETPATQKEWLEAVTRIQMALCRAESKEMQEVISEEIVPELLREGEQSV